MRYPTSSRLPALLAFTLLGSAPAPGTELVHEDYLERSAATLGFRLGRPRSVRVTRDGDEALFLRSGPRSFEQDLYALDLRTGEERVLLTAQSILEGAEETLTPEEKARRERMRQVARGIARYALSDDGERILVPLSGRLFVIERATERVRELPDAGGAPLDARFSPDGEAVVCVRDGDLYRIDLDSGDQERLAERPTDAVSFGTSEFVAQEEMGRMRGFWFSPEGRFLAYQRTDVAEVETFHLAEPLHPEKEPQPWPYPRAGTTNAEVRLFVRDTTTGRDVEVRWDRDAFEYLAAVTWSEGAPLTVLLQNRTQTVAELRAVDPRTGETRRLLREEDPAWVDLHGGMPRWVSGGEGFLWVTERRGRAQLELRHSDGDLARVLTRLEDRFHAFGGVDPARREVLFTASPDPTRRTVCRVPLDGGPVETLLDASGLYWVGRGAHEGRARVTVQPERGPAEVRFLEGERLLPVTARSVAEEPPLEAAVEWTTVGPRRWHALVIRPRDMRPGWRYPVILEVYGGPTHAVVNRAARWYGDEQWLADQGFVLVQIDARGTPGRGRAWQRAVKDDLISIPIHEQARALRLLGRRYPEMDLARVGVHGWSFGGYFAAMAALRRPDLFQAAVAGAPVADWRDYDTHYTERYMGLPAENPEGYEQASLLTHAPKLRRPLLLIHGTGDDNVYFLHSLKLARALFRAGRTFEFLPLPGFTHMVPDPEVRKALERRVVGFFREHLGEPGPARQPSRPLR